MLFTGPLLAIETSCDECSASVVDWFEGAPRALSLVIHNQDDLHRPYGGVVPEIASRDHLEAVNDVIHRALQDAQISQNDLRAIAVTNRPGLVGSLLVGVNAAKALSYAWELPLLAINHLEGHAVSLFLDRPPKDHPIKFPLLLGIFSGGHTQLHQLQRGPELWDPHELSTTKIARSLDDAAGEAFDKIARRLGLEYPGGKWIDHYARSGNIKAFDFPRPLLPQSNPDFSFSGIKTSVALAVTAIEQAQTLEQRLADLCASAQESIIDMLVRKIQSAIARSRAQTLGIVGGVAANSRLRQRLQSEISIPVVFAEQKYCTDNAAMIGAAALFRARQNRFLSRDEALILSAYATTES